MDTVDGWLTTDAQNCNHSDCDSEMETKDGDSMMLLIEAATGAIGTLEMSKLNI